MLKEVLKRDSSSQKFAPYKIEDAIRKAFESENRKFDREIYLNVMDKLKIKRVAGVEDIQDLIEQQLYKANYFDVMKSFMVYRNIHKMQREHILGLNSDTTYINSAQTVQEYIDKEDWRVNANSNTGYSNAGLVNNSAGKVIANYWLDKIYSRQEGHAHRSGDYHIHDLDCLTGYCAGWSLRVLLNDGFNGVRGRVESRPPQHFREALGQMANFLGILQSEWAGAQAFSSFDTYLAPYVFKDNLSYKEIKKAITGFIFNLNVPARWGQCVPDTTEVLTKDGFKLLDSLSVGEEIYTVNIDKNELELKSIDAIQKYKYKGEMHQYTNRDLTMTVSPNHRIYHKNSIHQWKMQESQEIIDNKTPINIPISFPIQKEDYPITDEELIFMVFILTDGNIDSQKDRTPKIEIYKSPKRWGNEKIQEIAKKLSLEFTIGEMDGGFEGSIVNRYRFNSKDTIEILSKLNFTKREIPQFFSKLSGRQATLVLDIWMKLDGYDERKRLQCDNEKIGDSIQMLATIAGFGSRQHTRVIGDNKTATRYVRLFNKKVKSLMMVWFGVPLLLMAQLFLERMFSSRQFLLTSNLFFEKLVINLYF